MRKPKYVAVNGCDKCHLGYTAYPCRACGGLGGRCLNPGCRNGEVVEACNCNDKAWQEDFEIPEEMD